MRVADRFVVIDLPAWFPKPKDRDFVPAMAAVAAFVLDGNGEGAVTYVTEGSELASVLRRELRACNVEVA